MNNTPSSSMTTAAFALLLQAYGRECYYHGYNTHAHPPRVRAAARRRDESTRLYEKLLYGVSPSLPDPKPSNP